VHLRTEAEERQTLGGVSLHEVPWGFWISRRSVRISQAGRRSAVERITAPVSHTMTAQPKMRIIRDRAWLDYLHDQPCIITGLRGTEHETVDPAHIGTLGKGIKSSDDEVLPILHRYHQDGHQRGELRMWRQCIPDDVLRSALRAYARELYQAYLAMKG